MPNYTLAVDSGTFTLTGSLLWEFLSGSYAVTGSDATLTWANGSAMSLDGSIPQMGMDSFAQQTSAEIWVSLPKLTGVVNAISPDVARIAITLGWPSLDLWTASLRGGGHLAGVLPSLLMGVETLVAATANIAARINVIDALLTGSGENLGTFDLDLPQLDSTINVQSEIIGHISGALPVTRFDLTGKTGNVGRLDIDLPIAYYDSVLLSQGIIALDVTLPALIIDSYGTYSDVTISYRVLVANTTNFGMTEYPDCSYAGMAAFNGDTIAIRGNSLVKLGATLDDDQPIGSLLQTGTLDFSNPVWMMPRDVWITLRSGKKIKLTVKEDEGPDGTEYSYESENFIPTLRKTRVKLGRGFSAGYYDFMLENVDGEYIDIEGVNVHSMALKGKKR